MTEEELKENIWGISEIRRALKIGKNKAYEYVNMDSCPATKDGKGWTVYSDDFCDWYREMKKNKQKNVH